MAAKIISQSKIYSKPPMYSVDNRKKKMSKITYNIISIILPIAVIAFTIFLSNKVRSDFKEKRRLKQLKAASRQHEQNLGTNKPAFVDEWMGEANEHYSVRKFQRSVDLYEKILEVQPLYVPALVNLGNALRELERYPDSERLHLKSIELSPSKAKYHYNLGVTYQHWGRLQDAIHSYSVAIDMDSGMVNALYNRGVAFQEIGELELAIRSYASTLQLEPKHLEARLNYCNIIFSMHKVELAEQCYHDVLSLDPGYVRGIVNLASFYHSTAPENPTRYKELFEQAISIDPGNLFAAHALRALHGDDLIADLNVDYIKGLFDSYSFHFDDSLRGLQYEAPNVVANAVVQYGGALLQSQETMTQTSATRKTLAVLDLGAGTGLACEPLVTALKTVLERSSVNIHVIGVDLSEKMLYKAVQRQCYQSLITSEAVAFLQSWKVAAVSCDSTATKESSSNYGEIKTARSFANIVDGGKSEVAIAGAAANMLMSTNTSMFDIVVAADVLVYFGDLMPMLSATHAILNPVGSLLVFTVEAGPGGGDVTVEVSTVSPPTDRDGTECISEDGGACKTESIRHDKPFFLQSSGRFAHTAAYIRYSAERAGYSVLSIRPVTLRWDQGQPVRGLVVVLTPMHPGS